MSAPLDHAIGQIIPLLPLRDPMTMTPQRARDELRALASARRDLPLPKVRAVESAILKTPSGSIPARVYRVALAPAPTVLFYHGGGWVAGDLDTHDRQARRLAIETGAVVISVDYRRPPETPFPCAFEDCFGAVRDVISRINEFGSDAGRVGVAKRQRRRQSCGCHSDRMPRRGDQTCGTIARLSGNRRCRGFGCVISFAFRERERLFSHARPDALVLRAISERTCSCSDWRVSPLRATTHAGLAPAVTWGIGTYAAKRATTTIPIVMMAAADVVAMGLASSLAHPGGNLTGLTFFAPELMGKRLELLKEIAPSMTRAGVLFRRNLPSTGSILEVMDVTAKALGGIATDRGERARGV
jgi:acetyl esterase